MKIMIELLFLTGILLILAVGISIGYYTWLKKIRKEYEKAHEVIQDIILSFNRQLEGEANNLALVGYKVEAINSKMSMHLKTMEALDRKTSALEQNVGTIMQNKESINLRLEEMDTKLRDVVMSKEPLVAKLSNIEEQMRQFSITPEARVEAVIPIKKERALAPLTETELLALEYLASEGAKTAPDIKDKIKLSREHTARLMKKLYEEGYLERDTSRIPFKYSVKKEMETLLAKKEDHVT